MTALLRGALRWRRVAAIAQQLGAWREQRPRVACPPDPVLALAAHPDDESLAFGGTLARLAAAGVQVHVICATDGEASLAGGRRVGARRRAELSAACGWLGVGDVECLALPDGRLPAAVDALAGMLDERIRRLRPAAVLLPWWRDAHRDHRALSAAIIGTNAPDALQVWAGEIWTPLPATHIVDISGAPLMRKHAALTAYRTAASTLQLDAMLGLNRYRAFAATPGCEAAEAFIVATLAHYRELVRRTHDGALPTIP